MTAGLSAFAALVRHDLRLSWRGFSAMFGGASRGRTAAICAAVFCGLHLAAWPAVAPLAPMLRGDPSANGVLGAVLGGILAWMIAQSLFAATRTLYDRGDLDLLLGSPQPAMRVIGAKAVAIAASTFAGLALFLLPLADMGVVLDGPHWLAVYPVLASLALMATAAGILIAMGLFMGVGPERARLYAHMTGASIGGAFVLGAQIIAVLPEGWRSALADFVMRGQAQTGLGAFLLSLPTRAATGEAMACLLFGILAVCAFTLTIRLTAERFARAASEVAGAPRGGMGAGAKGPLVFQAGGARSLRLKEWRLLTRDPSLFAQLGLQIVYTIPIAVVLLRSDLVPTAFALVPTITVIAAQVAGSIAWLTVSGEDAPELIATAPVSSGAANGAKLSAVVLPVIAIIGLPLLVLAYLSPVSAVVAACFSAGGAACTSLLNFWHPMPGNRRGMLRRHQQSRLVGLVEHGLAMLWAFASVFALIGSLICLAPIGLALGILVLAERKHRRTTDDQRPYPQELIRIEPVRLPA